MLWPELDTPALRIDLDRMERNLEEMAAARARACKCAHTQRRTRCRKSRGSRSRWARWA